MTDLELPVALVPIDIPKPWGRERWLHRFRPSGIDQAKQHSQQPQFEAAGAEPATRLLARMII